MPRYALSQRLIHWLIAFLVIGAFGAGATLGQLGFKGVTETFGADGRDLIYKYHKTFGVIILSLMILRLIVKVRLGKPAYATPLTKFEHIASNAVHGLLYLALLAMPVVGWWATAASGYPVEFFNWTLPGIFPKDKALGETLYHAHGLLGRFIFLLVVIHIAAALRHAVVKRDGVLRRML